MDENVFRDWNLVGTTLEILQNCAAIHFFNCGKSAFIVYKGSLYGYGEPHSTMQTDNLSGFTVPQKLFDLEDGVKAISSGYNHVALLDDKNSLWTWGLNDHLQIGNGDCFRRDLLFRVPIPRVIQFACGPMCTLAVDINNEVWFWGRLNVISDRWPVFSVPTRVILTKCMPAIQVSCGSAFAAIVTSDNRLFTWGSNDFGQLGHGHKVAIGKPRMVSAASEVVAALCASSSIIFLVKDGRVYVMGRTGFSTCETVPKQILFSNKIVAIAACWRLDQFGAEDETGVIHRWGLHDACDIPQSTDLKDIRQIYSNNVAPVVFCMKDRERSFTGLITPKIQEANAPNHRNGNFVLRKGKNKNISATTSDFQLEKLSDLRVRLSDGDLNLHSKVIITSSLFFKFLLTFGPKKHEIDMSEFDAETCRMYFRYAYTDQVDDNITIEHVAELYTLADNDEKGKLVRKCFEIWKEGLNRYNLIRLFVLAYKYKAVPLQMLCAPVIFSAMPGIRSTRQYAELPEHVKVAFEDTFLVGVRALGNFSSNLIAQNLQGSSS